MLPNLSERDVRDRALAHAEMSRNESLLDSSSKHAPNAKNDSFVQFRIAVSGPARCRCKTVWKAIGMHRIYARRHPFKILSSWIELVSILMIHLHASWSGTKERFRNNGVNLARHALIRDAGKKIQLQIAVAIKRWQANPGKLNLLRYADTRALKATHTSKIRDFVERLQTYYGPPFLIHGKNYNIGKIQA